MNKLLEQKNKLISAPIGELCSAIFSGGTPSTTNQSYWNGDILWLSSGETRKDFINETEKKITIEGVKNSSTRLALKGDIVIATAGQGLTRGQVSYLNIDTYINQSLISLRSDSTKLDSEYLYYNLKSRYIELRSLSDDTSSRGSITIPILSQMKINLPNLSEQIKISNILSVYDAKIENNKLIIEKLELAVMTLFNEWFVNFRFFGYEKVKFVESEMGKIPEGWKVGKIIDLGNIVCGKTPAKSQPEYFGGKIPFIKIPDMHNQVFIHATEDSLTEKGESTQVNKTIPEGSICVSCIATVGLVSITTKSSQTNQQINAVVPQNKEFTEYLYCILVNKKDDLQAIGSGGSTTLNVNTSVFSNLNILIPDIEIIKSFHCVVAGMFNEINHLSLENISLVESRNQLLLKLF